jgi:hypothetical protein
MSASARREAEHGGDMMSLHDRSPFDVFCFQPAVDFPVAEKQQVQGTLRIE